MVVIAALNGVVKVGMTTLLRRFAPIASTFSRRGEATTAADEAVPFHKLYFVEVPTKIVNYSCLGFCTVVGVPMIWRAVGLSG